MYKDKMLPTLPTLPPFVYICIWITLGYSMIMFNKVILSSWDYPYPLFLTTLHLAFATMATQLLAKFTPYLPGVKENKATKNMFFTKLVPLALFFAVGLVLGMYAYRYLSVGYLQMVKSMTPVPMLLLNFYLGREAPSMFKIFLVVLICGGVAMASVGEADFSMVGFVFQVLAIVCDCGRMCFMDMLLLDIKLDSLTTLYYTAPLATLFLGIGFFVLEFGTIDMSRHSSDFLVVLLISSIMAFMLNVSVMLLVSNTSSMVMSLCGLLKDILVVISSVLIFYSPISITQIVGYTISLIGLHIYRHYKNSPQELWLKITSALLGRKVHKHDIKYAEDTEVEKTLLERGVEMDMAGADKA